MKILIIHGSPRRGNTWNIVNKVREKINEEIDVDYEIIELSINKLRISFNSYVFFTKERYRWFNKYQCYEFEATEEQIQEMNMTIFDKISSWLKKIF